MSSGSSLILDFASTLAEKQTTLFFCCAVQTNLIRRKQSNLLQVIGKSIEQALKIALSSWRYIMKKSKPIEETVNKYLQDPEEASAYLEAVLEDGDSGALLIALRDIIDARGGVSELAKAKGLSRETLYRTLSNEGNPTLDTLNKVLEFAGLRVSILPLQDQQAKAS